MTANIIDVAEEELQWYELKAIDDTYEKIVRREAYRALRQLHKVFQHRKSRQSDDYEILVQYEDDISKLQYWLPLRGAMDPYILSPILHGYFQRCSDSNFVFHYMNATFDDKLMYACSAIIKKEPLTNDHHGLKYIDGGKKALKYEKARNGPNSINWKLAFSDELDRLFVRRKTCKFIQRNQLPKGRVVSYFNPQLTEKQKAGNVEYRVRGTVGGNINDFDGNKTSYTASLPSVKILLNAVISDPDAKFMTIDLKDFFLHGSSGRAEYMRIPLKWIPEADMNKYNIDSYIKPEDATVLVEITGNMYGLVNAALVSNQDVIKLLNSHGFVETNTPQIFKHTTRNIQFSLVVDDFGVKYNDDDDAKYLIATLQKAYQCTIDWTGKLYLGMTINIDRIKQVLSISMDGYIERLLARFDLPYKYNVDNPLPYASPNYGQKVQYVKHDNSPSIDATRQKTMQQALGGLLYYARAVGIDYTFGVNTMNSRQSDATEFTWSDFLHLMNFAATWPDCKLEYRPSDMVLILDADVSYLSESHARSRGAGVAYLGKKDDPTFINGPIDVFSVILPTVVSSVCEGEYAAAFLMAQLAMPLRVQLKDLNYKQDMFPNGSTLLTTDNMCAEGIANNSMKLKRSRAMDMRYHWLRDRVKNGDFTVQWRRNTNSLADFFTKTLTTKEFQRMRRKFIVPGPRKSPLKLRSQ
jgi:hypothetical protein